MSHLDYAYVMLSGYQKHTNIMQNMQSRAARITKGITKIGNNSITEIRSLHWLPIKERIDFEIAMLIHKCQNNHAPMYIQELITEKKIKHPRLHSSKAKFQLEVPSTKRCTFANRSFSVYGPKLWNTPPNSIKEITRTNTFKGKLKTYLFAKAYY